MPPRKQRRQSTASSSRAPPPPDPEPEDDNLEQPTGLYAILPMVCESEFVVEDFNDHDLALFGLRYVHIAGIQAILSPARRKAYPRLVRLFYEHLNQTSTGGAPNLTFTSSIDGHIILINEAIVAQALGVPLVKPPNCPLQFENVPDDIHSIAAVISNGALGAGSSIRRTQLIDNLLFLDSIFEKNLEPAGHAERRDEHLKALFSAISEQWFSPARLVLRSLRRTFNAISGDGSHSTKLFLPLLISRLLEIVNFPISANEEEDGAPLCFDTAQFHASLSRIPRLKGRHAPPVHAAGSRVPPSMQALAERFENLSAHVDERLDAFQERIDDGLEEMMVMQEAGLYAQYGDQTDALIAESRRRRYRRRNQ